MSAFPLVGKWLVLKVGEGNRVRLGEDPWVGCDENFKLPRNIVGSVKKLWTSRL